MSDVFIPARKIHALLNYVKIIGANPKTLCTTIELDYERLLELEPNQNMSGIHYSRLYLKAVQLMEEKNKAIPWAAGIGSTSFRLMCYNIISCGTLGQAIDRSKEFCEFMSPISGHNVDIQPSQKSTSNVQLSYFFEHPDSSSAFAPPEWERSVHYDSVVLSSGLRALYSLYCWLIGRAILLDYVSIAAPSVSNEYHQSLERCFACPVIFNADVSSLHIRKKELNSCVIQNSDTLQHFLRYVLDQLWAKETKPKTTAEAIKSILSTETDTEFPLFADIASRLYMSASTLRRRLIDEGTSYGKIKDEIRQAAAIEHLSQEQYKIHEIASILGYAETSSFIRSFRKWTGMTPKAYRETAATYRDSRTKNNQ